MNGRPVRIGLMGGSFNPAHRGHRAISLFAIEALGLDEVWWLVSPGNPLKAGSSDMAPLKARLASARAMARRSRIRATAIESQLGTRYTVDTLARVRKRYPKRDFIWIMGADNLANFHQWYLWRNIARQMPIAVIARPGYDGNAISAPAMAWFGHRVRPRDQAIDWTRWSMPALVLLRFRPDPRSATAVRRSYPDWFLDHADRPVRDAVTRKLLS
ncbi:nicotinate-nucleotide adenylyltransferase [Blastomonas aquatica]|uniref:Probable nicotinate-nucleotide adenylyltransferase n=1 Tax=Blastomonas aquatica TaxID=1510276 RepID=A0ABQ1J5D7_9SPHN|nr:nicotinate-nucleotide adenylyltransferase [Blastomonas aquatica]GGB59248.1 putative nicotinate-nucleotide adenylyltransferase [Blastomonas aquatica]